MSTLRAYFELLRLPAVFTAMADVMMGYLVTHQDLRPVALFLLLAAASSCLYLAGMVFNDVFDADLDARQRPQRPIPSGRVAHRSAWRLAASLLGTGVAAASLAGWLAGTWRPGTIAVLLAFCILLYDGALKRIVVAPLGMGACRMLNVLLGMSLAGTASAELATPWGTPPLLLAAGIGLYIVGVTLLARTETATSNRGAMTVATTILVLGLALLASAPWGGAVLVVAPQGWYLLWAVLALIIVRRCVVAIVRPTPQLVQAAVRHCLRSIIVIDAAIVLGHCGVFWGCAVLLLLAPMLLLETWFLTT